MNLPDHHRRSIRLKGYYYTQPGASAPISIPAAVPISARVNNHAQRLRARTAKMQPMRRAPRSLSSCIAGFKAIVTSRAGRKLNAANIWQRNYYEQIVRSKNEFLNFWNYIGTNPLRWHEDQLHPAALPNQFNQDNP